MVVEETPGRRFGLLGPLEAAVGGRVVPISTPKLRVLLAALLARANAAVPMDRLVEHLWGERPPSTARKTVQVYALRLRRLLGDDPHRPTLIHTRSDGYSIEVGPEELDLTRFAAAVRQAAAAAGDPVAELAWLDRARECWRGQPLGDVPSESLRREVAPRLAEEWLRAQERRVQLHLDLGRHREVVGELVRLTEEHPWQEAFWAQLILALHAGGRQADALDAYRVVDRRFREELGIDPGERLRRAHRVALTAPAPEPPAPRAPAASGPPAVVVGQLPAAVRGFVGRSDLVPGLTALLADGAGCGAGGTPIAVVSGPPGVGKTALALQVAHRVRHHFADGQLHVDLRGYAAGPPLAPAEALARFIGALGVPRERVPADPDERAALFRGLLAGSRMLVVLDNACHPDQVRPLLPGVPGCAVLITSRNDLRGLGVSQDVDHVPLDVLSPGESRAVLAQQLGPARAGAEPAALAELAAVCAHLPLALRIAGANLAADPHRRIGDYVVELRGAGRLARLAIDGDERSAVLVAFDQSYLDLRPDDRSLFRSLGLVAGPDFTPEDAAALVAGSPRAARRALDRLTAANLLHQHAPGRYRFHDLIREYAAGRARAEDHPGLGLLVSAG